MSSLCMAIKGPTVVAHAVQVVRQHLLPDATKRNTSPGEELTLSEETDRF